MQELAIILLGLMLLWGGTELVIDGAIRIARHFGMSEILIGLTVLAIGSDLPETVVALHGAFLQLAGVDTSDLIVGNAVGSAFVNIGLVMGLSGLVVYLTLSERFIFIHGGMLLLSVILLFFAGQDGIVTRLEGSVLVAVFAIYLVMAFKTRKDHQEKVVQEKGAMLYFWSSVIAGLVVVYVGSELTITSAAALAEHFGISQSLIAIAIIGVGTSLPELSISIAAAIKKKGGLSVGNIIGSNIYDALVPIGAAAVIAPVAFERSLLWFDLPVLFGLSLLTLVFFRRKRGLQKGEAATLMLIYFGYLAFRIMRG
jgi:cation:H+ antiporter